MYGQLEKRQLFNLAEKPNEIFTTEARNKPVTKCKLTNLRIIPNTVSKLGEMEGTTARDKWWPMNDSVIDCGIKKSN